MPTQLSFDFEEWQPLEKLDERIRPEQYRIYPSGGLHPFALATNALPRYRQPIWPYVRRIHYEEKKDTASRWRMAKGPERQMNPHLRMYGSPYPSIMLETQGTRTYKASNKPLLQTCANSHSFNMHRLVALAFVKRDPRKTHVLHLNDDPTNYLPENLKWGTNSENHAGKKVDKETTIEDKYTFYELKGLIRG